MKLSEIRGKGFYTNGIELFYNESKKKDGKIIVFIQKHIGNERFLKAGVGTAYCKASLETEVELVKKGDFFMNGDIEVIDAKTLSVLTIEYINQKFDSKGYTVNADEIEYIDTIKTINF